MSAGTGPKRREPHLPPAERAFAEPRDPDEPRFAGPPTASMQPAPPMPSWFAGAPPTPEAAPSSWADSPGAAAQAAPAAPAPPEPVPSYPPTFPPPPYPPPGAFPPAPAGAFPPAPAGAFPPGASDLEPVVGYGPGVQPPDVARDGLLVSRVGSAVAIAGGFLAALGTLFTWATLRLVANGADAQGFTADSSRITYNGLSMLEGRVILVLGIVAIVLSALAVPRSAHRLLSLGMAITGALAVIVMAFAAIGHPVELATLFRSYGQIDAVKVSLPNGVGTWLAVIGSLLVLAGGLLALMRGSEAEGEGRA